MVDGLIDITEEEFKKISELVYERFGINLTEKKVTLVKGRLNKYIRQKGFTNFSSYYDSIIDDGSGKELLTLIDKISTNHTFFYREPEHFQLLSSRYLSQWSVHRNPDDLRLWCAGCSSGEEAYTLAMTINEYFSRTGEFTGPVIFANDISTTALEVAVKGIYTMDRIHNLPENLIKKYFKRIGPDELQIRDELKKLILFKRMNFISPSYNFKGKFDFVFFRNVMIYFDMPTKISLLEKIHKYMKPGGILFIGHSESLGREQEYFKYIQPAVYERIGTK